MIPFFILITGASCVAMATSNIYWGLATVFLGAFYAWWKTP